jgi:hypothetical protein
MGAQTLLGSLLGTNSSALLSASDNLPASAAALSIPNSEALARYAFDPSLNPTSTSHQFAASAQQSPLTSGLNLLA